MASISLNREASLLLVVDLQEGFLDSIFERERVVQRSLFLIQTAQLLGIPVVATTQNPGRLGQLLPAIAALVPNSIPKMTFSCWGSDAFKNALESTARRQIVVVGVETHICVGMTAQDMLDQGYEVAVSPDAVSASNLERHKLGMERIRDAGAVPVHSEAVAYEWIGSADDPKFKPLLQLVKQSKSR